MLNVAQIERLTGISSARLMFLAEMGGISSHKDPATKLPLFDPQVLKNWIVRPWTKQ